MNVDVEAEPAAAAELAGDRIELLRRYTANLVARGEELGLIGPLELPRIWTRHVLNSAVVAPLLGPGLVGDVGSGAGLPGIVLAALRPDLEFVLIEPMERRVLWLEEQVADLGLGNTRVLRARAEEARGEVLLDTCTARAVSALKKLVPMTAPLVRAGGELIFLKGNSVDAEIAAATTQLKKARVVNPRVEILGDGLLSESTRVFRATVEGRPGHGAPSPRFT
ncbi:16S rRNA (guanine(527)-N(7))-methyltransferase RsmG [Leucobacter sp. M11]|uniref:16S rRNA (guanine(527)-N(7))-methyltransferase RsmG n=1 Tax=Leucobacter sp. M11 TaxID=2993565 RepID=UPI002D7E7081|nr:16S rRNA (guanine(527)-N(7))-methyltransferase RsmG [Leucobacter sp. M11]MEB4614886.1 16S rRNA (guanine(527)-N(7))-methyltransferase RsmG [Leucobacter sp. M11]